jgi:hypothetical protein
MSGVPGYLTDAAFTNASAFSGTVCFMTA